MTLQATAADRQTVERFNRDHPIGTKVYYWPGVREGEGRPSWTRSQAHLLSGHTPVVWVEGYAGCIALTHVEAVKKPCPTCGLKSWDAPGLNPGDRVCVCDSPFGEEPVL